MQAAFLKMLLPKLLVEQPLGPKHPLWCSRLALAVAIQELPLLQHVLQTLHMCEHRAVSHDHHYKVQKLWL
jgi:hypothetical protein